MTAPRPGTFQDGQGARWYRDPANPSKTYAGVTSILNAAAKPGLEKAKVNGVATYAAKNRKMLAEQNQATVISILKNNDAVLPDWKVGRDYGSAVHQVIENIINDRPLDYMLQEVEGTPTYPVSNTFTEWVPRCWGEFVETFKYEPVEVEATVMSDQHRYAGSLDHMGYVTTPERGRHLAIIDAKTNKRGPQASVAVQNKAYSCAGEFVNIGTGARRPIPKVEGSYVLWMHETTLSERPDWDLLPLAFGEEQWREFYARLVIFAHSKTEHEWLGESLTGKTLFNRWTPNR
jgi:hypothetical protein